MTHQIAPLQEGQKWQCRDQRYHGIVNMLMGETGGRVAIYSSDSGYIQAHIYPVRVVNKNEAAYRIKPDRRDRFDLVLLLYPVD